MSPGERGGGAPRPVAGLLAVALVAMACTSGGSAGPTTRLVVLAAASMKAPLERAAAAYEPTRPGLVIDLAFDSSAALRTQIVEGAPADLFLSADLANPERIQAAGLGGGPVTPFARNGVVIAAPVERLAVESWHDLARDDVAIIAAGPDVPISAYATQLVAALAALPEAGGGYAAAYEHNVVSREDNVRAVAAKLELGEGDAGIVYRTDAIGSTNLRTIPLPDGVDVTATYGAIVIRRSEQGAEAAAFLGWLSGPDGQSILVDAGFEPVR